MQTNQLSPKSRTILTAIAHGHSYDQILAGELDITYYDIFQAAAEALQLAPDTEPQLTPGQQRLVEIQLANPRAYEKWSPQEDAQLSQLFSTGKTAKEIADLLQRQPSAIRSRLIKLGLVPLHPASTSIPSQPCHTDPGCRPV